MAAIVDLIRREPRARAFLAAHGQSALGTGAGYVALLLVAHERFASPWAIALVLLADFLPAMLLGPLLGALADRWPRRRAIVCADAARALAFCAIALVDGFAATVALALLAGSGTALYRAAAVAALPSLVAPARVPALTAAYGALDDAGHTLGPALGAAALVAAGPEALLAANGATFAASAAVLARVRFGGRAEGRPGAVSAARGGAGGPGAAGTGGAAASACGAVAAGERTSRDALRALAVSVRAGAAAARGRGVAPVVLASSAVVLFAGLFNVAELLLAKGELGAGASGFSTLVAVYGAGAVAGSLSAARARSPAALRRRYVAGIGLVGAGMCAAALAPSYWLALAPFALAGVGNGLVVVHERLLLGESVPDALLARVLALKDSLSAWCFGASFAAAGLLAAALGPRGLVGAAGAGALCVCAGAAWALRGAPAPAGRPGPAGRPDPLPPLASDPRPAPTPAA